MNFTQMSVALMDAKKEILRQERLHRQNQALKDAQVIKSDFNDPFKYKAPVRRSARKSLSGNPADSVSNTPTSPYNAAAVSDGRRKLIFNSSIALFEYNGPRKLIPMGNCNPQVPSSVLTSTTVSTNLLPTTAYVQEQGIALVYEPSTTSHALIVYEPLQKQQLLRVEIDAMFTLTLIPSGVATLPVVPVPAALEQHKTPYQDTATLALFTDDSGNAFVAHFKDGENALTSFAQQVALVRYAALASTGDAGSGEVVTQDSVSGPYTSSLVNIGDLVKIAYRVYKVDTGSVPFSLGEVVNEGQGKYMVGCADEYGVPEIMDDVIVGMKRRSTRVGVAYHRYDPSDASGSGSGNGSGRDEEEEGGVGRWGENVPVNCTLCVEVTVLQHRSKDDTATYRDEVVGVQPIPIEAPTRETVVTAAVDNGTGNAVTDAVTDAVAEVGESGKNKAKKEIREDVVLPRRRKAAKNGSEDEIFFGDERKKDAERVAGKDREDPESCTTTTTSTSTSDSTDADTATARPRRRVTFGMPQVLPTTAASLSQLSPSTDTHTPTASAAASREAVTEADIAAVLAQDSEEETDEENMFGKPTHTKTKKITPPEDSEENSGAAQNSGTGASEGSLSERMKRLARASGQGPVMVLPSAANTDNDANTTTTTATTTTTTATTTATVGASAHAAVAPVAAAPTSATAPRSPATPSSPLPTSTITADTPALALMENLGLAQYYSCVEQEALLTVGDMLMLDVEDWKSIAVPLAVRKKLIMKLSEVQESGAVAGGAGVEEREREKEREAEEKRKAAALARAKEQEERERALAALEREKEREREEEEEREKERERLREQEREKNRRALISLEMQAKIDEAYDRGRADTLSACKAKIDSMRTTANARFQELQDEILTLQKEVRRLNVELDGVTKENIKNKELVRGYVAKSRDAREQSLREIAQLGSEVESLKQEKTNLKSQFKQHVEEARAQGVEDKRVLVKKTLESTFGVIMSRFDVNEVMDGEEIMRRLKEMLKGVATTALSNIE